MRPGLKFGILPISMGSLKASQEHILDVPKQYTQSVFNSIVRENDGS